jgi:hypothetical protein
MPVGQMTAATTMAMPSGHPMMANVVSLGHFMVPPRTMA